MGLIRKELDKTRLDHADYVHSLLQEAVRGGVVTQDTAQAVQMDFFELLQKRVRRFTFDESSSVPIETAEGILQSVFYTVGVELKSHSNLEDQVNLLLDFSPEDLYWSGLKKLKVMFADAKHHYEFIKQNALPLGIRAYHDTIEKGIAPFFAHYDLEFGAKETTGSIDYPLALDKMDRIGVEYILLYLKKLRFENQFCNRFSTDTITMLLQGYHRQYSELLINAFQIVLKNYIGCMLVNQDKSTLILMDEDCLQIERRLFHFTDKEYQGLAGEVNTVIVKEMKLESTFEQEYLLSVIKEAMISFQNAVKEGKTTSFFVLPLKEIPGGEMRFADGTSLRDSDFQQVSKEIGSCRYLSDKIAILQRKIHSITDIADLLNADCFYGTEYAAYFQTLSNMELALLLTHTILFHFSVEDTLLEQLRAMPLAAEWQMRLCCYLDSVNTIQVQEITDYIRRIVIE